jgi:hypothetical protein
MSNFPAAFESLAYSNFCSYNEQYLALWEVRNSMGIKQSEIMLSKI